MVDEMAFNKATKGVCLLSYKLRLKGKGFRSASEVCVRRVCGRKRRIGMDIDEAQKARTCTAM